MSKKTKNFKMELEVLDSGSPTSALPASWQLLEQQGFHSDLLEIASRYHAQAKKLGYPKEAEAFLEPVGEGFLLKFDSSHYRPKKGDPQAETKNKVLDALEELSEQFGDRVSTVVWDSYAHLATRKDVEEEASILDEADTLPHPWYVVDSVLHSVAKAYSFKLHIDTVVFEHASVIVLHGCGCNCSIMPIETAGNVDVRLDPGRFHKSTFEVMSHLVSESLLIMAMKMPFAMGFSDDAQQVLMADGFMKSLPQSEKKWRSKPALQL